MSSRAKKVGQAGAYLVVLMEGPATLGKKSFPSTTNNPTHFRSDWHNDFHNEELGPTPITVWRPDWVSILQTPAERRQGWARTTQGGLGGEQERRQRKEIAVAGAWACPSGSVSEDGRQHRAGPRRRWHASCESRWDLSWVSHSSGCLFSQAGPHVQNLQSVFKCY